MHVDNCQSFVLHFYFLKHTHTETTTLISALEFVINTHCCRMLFFLQLDYENLNVLSLSFPNVLREFGTRKFDAATFPLKVERKKQYFLLLVLGRVPYKFHCKSA